MVTTLKGEQRVSLKFEGSGPLRKIITEADADGAVRGTVAEPRVDLPHSETGITLAPALGRAGFLTVRKDLGLKEPYSGSVQLYNSEIASDLAYYFTESEQIPSAVGLGVFLDGQGEVAVAGGFMLQSLPPSDPARVDQLARQAEGAPPLSTLLLQSPRAEDLLGGALGDLALTILDRRPLRFQCSCSRQRVERALASLGSGQLTEMVRSGEDAEIACEFCRQRYVIPSDDLSRLVQVSH
jgi:molecular chaperone Hsp33